MFDINNLPKNLVVDGFVLELDLKLHRGIGNLADIIWYQYEIKNYKEKNIPYDNISLAMFSVTEEVRLEASENIINQNVSSPNTKRPHIDYTSGNIHPSKEYVEKSKEENKIAQLVLCSGLGPRTSETISEKIYLYKKPSQKRGGCQIHKACYYPLISEDESLMSDWRYVFLKKVWETIF